MRIARRLALGLVFLLLLLIVACRSTGDYQARFVKYYRLPDGTQAALVAPVTVGSAAEQQIAFAKIDGLKPGDLVWIEPVGKDWDQPRWTPDIAVSGRVK